MTSPRRSTGCPAWSPRPPAALVAAEPSGVVLAGHSAGGHLALWAASRHRLPPGSRWHAGEQRWRGVVALAAVSDLAGSYRKALGQQAAGALMGGGPMEFADGRYHQADPSRLLPAGAPVWLVHGDGRRPGALPDEPRLRPLGQGRWGARLGCDVRACCLEPGISP